MMSYDSNKTEKSNTEQSAISHCFVIDENGKEIPITDDMVETSMQEIKLQSIGAHTGYHKVITDEMLMKGKKK